MTLKAIYLKKCAFLFFLSTMASGAFAQCTNTGFELGNTSEWICGSGTYGIKGFTDCNQPSFPTIISFDGNCLNQGGIDGSNYPKKTLQNRHTLVTDSSGKDPNSLNNVPCLAPASLFPSGVNKYSFRLGNAVGFDSVSAPPVIKDTVAQAEAIKITLTVSPSNAGLTYMYALFINEDIQMQHQPKETARFTVKITDQNGQPINCGSYELLPTSYGFKDGLQNTIGGNHGIWKYTDWKKVTLDLSPYIGQTITIQFTTTDCVRLNSMATNNGITTCNYLPGLHSAYAYLDMYCAPVITNTVVNCEKKDSIKLCAPAGYGFYRWPPSLSNTLQNCLTVKSPSTDKDTVYKVDLFHHVNECVSTSFITVKGKLDFKTKNAAMCADNGSYQLEVVPVSAGNSFKWEPQLNLDKYDIATPVFTPGNSTTYTVTMFNDDVPVSCNAVKTVEVYVKEKAIVEVSDLTIQTGETVVLQGKVSGGGSTGTWVGGTGTFNPDRAALNAVYTPSAAEENAGSVQLTLESIDSTGICPAAEKIMNLTILPVATGSLPVNKHDLSIEVYPNPFNTVTIINISGLTNASSTIMKLYDYLGKEILSVQLKNGSQKLDRANLASGIYFMEITDNGNVLQKKKIVIND